MDEVALANAVDDDEDDEGAEGEAVVDGDNNQGEVNGNPDDEDNYEEGDGAEGLGAAEASSGDRK